MGEASHVPSTSSGTESVAELAEACDASPMRQLLLNAGILHMLHLISGNGTRDLRHLEIGIVPEMRSQDCLIIMR